MRPGDCCEASKSSDGACTGTGTVHVHVDAAVHVDAGASVGGRRSVPTKPTARTEAYHAPAWPHGHSHAYAANTGHLFVTTGSQSLCQALRRMDTYGSPLRTQCSQHVHTSVASTCTPIRHAAQSKVMSPRRSPGVQFQARSGVNTCGHCEKRTHILMKSGPTSS